MAKKGSIYLQYGFYTKQQMEILTDKFKPKEFINDLFISGYGRQELDPLCVMCDINKIIQSYVDEVAYTSDDPGYFGILPQMLFGDHFEDNYRLTGKKRKFGTSGQAKIVGPYDKTFGFGISTGFRLSIEQIGFDKWTELIVKEFNLLQEHVKRGGDVIIPIPSYGELKQNSNLYFHNRTRKQIINHTLGTGNSMLPFSCRLFIQQQIDILKLYAKEVNTVQFQLFQE